MDDAEMTLSGSAFQTLAVATEKGRLPVVDVLKDGSTSWLVAVDRSVYRCDTSTVPWRTMQLDYHRTTSDLLVPIM